MISSVNYFCVENNYFIVALCYPYKMNVPDYGISIRSREIGMIEGGLKILFFQYIYIFILSSSLYLQGVLEETVTYILFWTLLYGIVHVY